jgi:hypothetical protein
MLVDVAPSAPGPHLGYGAPSGGMNAL